MFHKCFEVKIESWTIKFEKQCLPCWMQQKTNNTDNKIEKLVSLAILLGIGDHFMRT